MPNGTPEENPPKRWAGSLIRFSSFCKSRESICPPPMPRLRFLQPAHGFTDPSQEKTSMRNLQNLDPLKK